MRGKALNAKYSVSLCLPFPSGTLPPPELFSTDFEDELEQLQQFIWILTPRKSMKGEWNMCIGSVEQGKRNMESDARKCFHWYSKLDFLSNQQKGETLSLSLL